MLFRSVIRKLSGRSAQKLARRNPRAINRRRLRMESLESRRLLAFVPQASYPTGEYPFAVVTADLNHDNRLDLVTANYDFGTNSSSLSVLLGNAAGSFQPAQSTATNVNLSSSVAVGDFNSDGNLDLATAGGLDVNVLLGNGSGAFPNRVSAPIGASVSSVAVGDFNADGKLDLAATANTYVPGGWGYYSWYPGDYEGSVSVLLGNGDGSLSVSSSQSLGWGYLSSAVVGDLNGDGKQDVAAANSYTSVIVLPGFGNGALGAALYHNAAYGNDGMAAGDVNGDGKLDLIKTTGSTINVLLGAGAGAFDATRSFSAGETAHGIAIADFNGDGKTDLATANSSAGAVNILLGTGTGDFKPPVNAPAGGGNIAVAVGDFNRDGRVDAASTNSLGSVSILLNDGVWPLLSAPSILIGDVQVTEGNLGTTTADLIVRLSNFSSQTVTVQYATSGGTATAGSDYQAQSGTLTFAPGETSKTIRILVNGDRLPEYGEHFGVVLTNPVNAFLPDSTGIGAILDDEPSLAIDSYATTEGNTGQTAFSFTVTLSAAYDAPVTVAYATADLTEEEQWYYGPSATAGIDYTAKSGTLTFAPGETSQTITVLANGDRVGEWDEVFAIRLANSNFARIDYGVGFGTIIDDEPYVYIGNSNISIAEGNSGTKAVTIDLYLSAASDAPVTVSYSTVDASALAGSDYLAATGSVTFAAGQTSRTVAVQVKGDVTVEADEYFIVNLTGASGASISGSTGYVIIADDDTPPTIFIGDAYLAEGNSGTQLMTFTVSLSNASGQGVSVNYTTANGSAMTSNNDYVAKSGTLYFAPGETTKTITVSIKGDTKTEKDEYFYLNLAGATGGMISDNRGVGTILNDDGGGKRIK